MRDVHRGEVISPQPKPAPKSREKARAKRLESRHAQQVRADVFTRDVVCRLFDAEHIWPVFGRCDGRMTWAHLGANKRFKTRGMSPVDRHNSPGSCVLCEGHHRDYDEHRIDIQPVSSAGADGRLAFKVRETVYVEPAK